MRLSLLKPRGRKPRNEKEKLEWLKRLISPLSLWRDIELGGLSYPFTGIMGLETVNLEKELGLEKLHCDKERYEIDFGRDPLLGKWGVDGSTSICFWDKTKERRDKAKEPPSKEEEEIAKERQYRLTHAIQGLRQRLQLEYAQKKTIQPGLAEALVRRERQLRDAQNRRQIRQSSLARAIVELSLDEYFYDEWLPNLTAETMKSEDLLERICVVYAIKKAQNRDEKAIEKLFDLYKGRAEALADWFAKREGLDIKEVKNDALMILRNLIEGDKVDVLKDWLTKPNTTDSYLGIQTRKAKDIFLEYLLNYLPEELNKILNECNEYDEIKDLASIGQETRPDLADQWDEHIKWANSQLGVEGLKITALLDPLSIINRDTLYLSPSSLRKLTQLDPDNLLKKTWGNVFNRYVFQFRKEDNLTIWLFGQRNPRSYGAVEQRLRDYYRGGKKKRRKRDEDIIKEVKYEHELYEEPSPIENRYAQDAKNRFQDKEANEETEERAMERLMKAEISKRDAKICIEKAIHKTPSGEIGKMYGLKKRRINQIIKEVQEKLDKLKSRKE